MPRTVKLPSFNINLILVYNDAKPPTKKGDKSAAYQPLN